MSTPSDQSDQGLILYAPIWGEVVREALRSAVEDGISFIEARVNLRYSSSNGLVQNDLNRSPWHQYY